MKPNEKDYEQIIKKLILSNLRNEHDNITLYYGAWNIGLSLVQDPTIEDKSLKEIVDLIYRNILKVEDKE